MSITPNQDWPPPRRRTWPLTSQQAAHHAIVIAAIALVVAAIALVALVFAVSANALEQPGEAAPPGTTTPHVAVADVGTICVLLPDQRVLCEAREVWGQIVETARVEAAARAQAEADARLAARWLPVHNCEEGPGTDGWYAAGRAGNGLYVEGGLGVEVGLYRSIAGHSALLDSPTAQMRVAEIAYERGVTWGCPIR